MMFICIKQLLILIKKARVSLVPLMILPSSRCKRVFNLFFIPSWIWSCFCVDCEKVGFSCPYFVDSEIAIWGLTSLMDFYKRVHLLFKKRNMPDCQNKISFVQIKHPKVIFLTPEDIKSYYLANTFGISKLVSQSRLLPSLFELKDNDTIIMKTIIKKLQDM